MKRPVSLAAIVAFAILAISVAAMAQDNASVPNLINFQGRLTDNVGNPVTDGAHSVHFYIFPVRTGGVSIWDELQNPTTTGGLFTTQLGSATPLPQTLFQDHDSLFLEIVADAQLISPRTLLTGTPFTRAAEGLNGRSPYLPDSAFIRTYPLGHQLSTYGADGQEQIRLWGPSWGEIWLHDSSPSNFINAVLEGDNFPGGGLFLGNGAGATTIFLQGGAVGDNTAILPTDAIDSREILDEPGLSNAVNPSFFVFLGSGNISYVIDSVDITIPAPGYVEVTGGSYVNLFHTNGTATEVFVNIDKTRANGSFAVPGAQVFTIPASEATNLWEQGANVTRVYNEVAAGTYRYYLNADYASGPSGSTNIANSYIRATYYPTLYGTLTLAAASPTGTAAPATQVPTDGSKGAPNLQLTTITMADHQAKLEAEYAKQIADLEARIKTLEAKQTAAQQSGALRPR